ncbi:hypothetical protein GCM10020218_079050 [Dactylosporangium vinaceum]
MPISAAAMGLNPGSPTTAHQDPARDAAASNANITDDVYTATVAPRRSPPPGNRSRSPLTTGNVRVPATTSTSRSEAVRTTPPRFAVRIT